MPPIDPGYLRAVDGIRDELHRHIDDCMRDRQNTLEEYRRHRAEIAQELASDRAERLKQHSENQAAIRELRDAWLQAKGVGKLARALWAVFGGGIGAAILAGAAKLLGMIRW